MPTNGSVETYPISADRTREITAEIEALILGIKRLSTSTSLAKLPQREC